MIDIQHISKQFGKFQVLKDVNLTCAPGQCIALIGPNGCGKTTLIKSILGMVIPTSGTILFNGKNIASDYHYRHQIGYMPQKGRYPDNMTIGQVIDMIKDIRNTKSELDEELIDAFRLNDIMDKKMMNLSGGTTQKVSASLAFLFNPDVLILDEPTAGLDPLAAEILKEKIIAENKKGKLIFITSHLLSELDDLVTDVVLMQEGDIRFHMSTSLLKEQTNTTSLAKAITYILKRDHVQ
ncbi:MAG: ABC transporter ATP-binding protein [Saprospiraceae bacterium]|uniref:ABC transporter ATP-binding protein n=1 Tax=Candidatus Opimibacter skivensis TaxID=2982028 RepID=A0A9D7XSD7_9BACT|nr:ABC transporter ATP-binding protein [Candidatus Opimibacter skivensis]